MISCRKNVFETNSSSTHSLIIYREGESKKEQISPKLDMYSTVFLGEQGETSFVNYDGSVRISGFWDKLTYLVAFLICYYEDNVENYNFDTLYERFLKSCHYIWIKEWLLDEYCLHLELNKFRYSGVNLESGIFEELNLPFLYPDEFKEKIEEIVTNTDVVLEYTDEEQ